MEIWRVDDTTLDVWHGKVIVAMWMHLRIITHTCTNGRKNCVHANKSPFSKKKWNYTLWACNFPKKQNLLQRPGKKRLHQRQNRAMSALTLVVLSINDSSAFFVVFRQKRFFPCFVWFLFLESASRCLSTTFFFLILFAFSHSLISLSRKSKMCLSNFYWCTNEIDTFKRFLLS